MKLSTKNLLIILLVLIAGFALLQFTKRESKSKELKSELVSIDTARVSKIEISTQEGTVSLIESEHQWRVSDGKVDKNAKKGTVESLLNMLVSIQPGRLAARKQDKWKDYSVDSTGTRIKVYEGEDVTADLVVGRFGMENQRSYYTFVRLYDEENVYVANNFMSMGIGKKAADFRDGTLLQLKRDSLTSIRFDYPDSAFVLSKNDKWYVGDQPADSASVESYLRSLSFLTSKAFLDAELTHSLSHSITFTFSNQPEIKLEGYFNGKELLIRSTENPLEVFNDDTVVKKAFKGLNTFLPTSD